MKVLDDSTHKNDVASRRAMFPLESMLLRSVLDNLALAREDYDELGRRCDPLSIQTKQSLEINEEDHGKAIMVFTIVTIVFLPLSFVTSYLGMNTADIRDMNNTQSLFWIIAVPLTVFTVGTIMFIGYNGSELRDFASSMYRLVTGKQTRINSSGGLSVAQRKRVRATIFNDSASSDYTSVTYEAEFAAPRPDGVNEYGQRVYRPRIAEIRMENES